MNRQLTFISKVLILAVFVWVLIGALQTNAQDAVKVTDDNVPAKEIRENLRNQLNQMKEVKRGAVKNIQDEVKAKREELKKDLEIKREQAKNRIETVREEAREKAKAAREEFKLKIQKVKDEKKRMTAERLEEQLNRLNRRWTDHFTDVLNRLENVLAKIEIRIQKAQANGRDVATVKTAVEKARVAIKAARDAVAIQAAKVYTVKFESEDKLRAVFQTAKEQLHRDLAALRDGAIKTARQTVQDTIQALRRIPGVDSEPTATTTPAVTPAQ